MSDISETPATTAPDPSARPLIDDQDFVDALSGSPELLDLMDGLADIVIDPDTGQAVETDDEIVATPAPAPTSPPDEPEEPTIEQVAEPPSGGPGGGTAGPPPTAPPPTADVETDDATDLGDLAAQMYRDLFGTDPTPEALAETFAIANELRSLDDTTRARVQQALAPPTTTPQIETGGGGYDQPSPSAAPAGPTPAPTTLPQLPDDAYLDDGTKAYLQALAQTVEAQNAQLAAFHQTQTEAQQQAQQRLAQEAQSVGTTAAIEQFRAAYPEIVDGDFQRIRLKGATNTAWPGILAAYNGDYQRAVYAVLDKALDDLPDLKSRVANARIQAAADNTAKTTKRKDTAAKVAGGASTTPRRPDATMTATEAKDAMLDDLRALERRGEDPFS
jgi:hypothetical protein